MMKRQNRILSVALSLLLVFGILAPSLQLFPEVQAASTKNAMLLELPRPNWSASNRKGWGHGAITATNGWKMGSSGDRTFVFSLDSRSGRAAYCIAPGAPLSSGTALNENDEKYLDGVDTRLG